MTTPDNYSNFATSTIYGGAAGAGSNFQSTDLILILNPGDGAKFPNAPFPFTIGADTSTPEALDATNITGDQITVASRAPGAIGYAPGTLVQHGLTAAAIARIWSAITGPDHFPITDGFGSSLTVTNENTASESLIIANSAASGTIVIQAPSGLLFKNGATVEHSFLNNGNALHQGTLTVVGSSSLDNGVTVTDGAGLLTTTLTVSNKHTQLHYLSAVPGSNQGVIGVRVAADTVSRVSLQVLTTGYGAVALGPGGSTAATATLAGVSGGLSVTATGSSFSGTVTAGTGLTVTTGGATISAGGLTVTAGATSLDGTKVATDGSGKLSIGGAAGLANTQQAIFILHASGPGSDLAVVSSRVLTDGQPRVGLVLRATGGYGAIVLSNGSGVNPQAALDAVSGGLSVTALASSFSGSVTAGNGLTVTTGGLTVTAGGATVSAGNLTITTGNLAVSAGTATLAGGVVSIGGQTVTGSLGVVGVTGITTKTVVTATTLQTVLTFTPSVDGHYRANIYALVANGTSGNALSANVAYTDSGSVARSATFTMVSGTTSQIGNATNSFVNGSWAGAPLYFFAKAGSAISIRYQDPTNTPNDTVSAALERLG